jgi:hypothetical protein
VSETTVLSATINVTYGVACLWLPIKSTQFLIMSQEFDVLIAPDDKFNSLQFEIVYLIGT